jgi:hypothetical protein
VPLDHHVRFRSEVLISEVAAALRSAADTSRPYFNIVNYLNRLMTGRRGTKDQIEFDKYPRDYPDPSSHASVTFGPLTLHVAEDIWSKAREDDPFARFVLAHELGHISLHRFDEHKFSSDPTRRISFAEKEHSAEWQADTFALHFLMPDHLVSRLRAPDVLEAACMVPLHWARERIKMFDSHKKVLAPQITQKKVHAPQFTGDCCTSCGNFTLLPDGSCTKCDRCGAITEICGIKTH